MTTRIGRARQALHGALVGGTITADRAHLFPQTGQYPVPCAWVGLPTVVGERSSTVMTVPVIVVTSGNAQVQQQTIDDETARLWDALRAVTVDGYKANVARAEPTDIGPDGAAVLAVVLTVRLELATLTLCDAQPLIDPA